MPIWAWLYLAIIAVCGVFAYKLNRGRGFYYLPGEVMSVASVVILFLAAYEVVEHPYSGAVCLWLTLYLVYWEGWENRHHYSFSSITQQVSDAIEEEDLGDDVDEETVAALGWVAAFSGYVMAIVFYTPVFYVLYRIFSS